MSDLVPARFNYGYSRVTGQSMPSMYPGEKSDKWQIPEDIQSDFSRLNWQRIFKSLCFL